MIDRVVIFMITWKLKQTGKIINAGQMIKEKKSTNNY